MKYVKTFEQFEFLKEYMYPKGVSIKKGIGGMAKDIDRLIKYSKEWNKFVDEFYKKYPSYPDDAEAQSELRDLWDAYHEN